MKGRFYLYSIVVLILYAAACNPLLAVGLPENVLVVQNGNSPMSVRIASYYMSQRGIPSTNLVTIYTADSSLVTANERITFSDYNTQIEQPIRSFLSNNNLVNKIQYIVLTKGIPHRLTAEVSGGSTGGQSVDSMLAVIDIVNPFQLRFTDKDGNVLGIAYMNRYWYCAASFSHAAFGGYLVTRLDGYTEADAKALVDRALTAQIIPLRILLDATNIGTNVSAQPKSLIGSNGQFDPTYSLQYSDFNADLAKANIVIGTRPHLSVQLDQTGTFIGSSNILSSYVSWGSNDGGFSAATYHSLNFGPGSIIETAVSTSGRTFLPTTGGQSLIADLISQGAAGAKGYVTEPYLDAIASPTVLLDLYTSGRNLAESYYAASRFVGWKDVVIGDPLCSMSGFATTQISQAKALTDGWLVTISDARITAGTNDFNGAIYIEDKDRVSGIKVQTLVGFPTITRGKAVTVRGILGTSGGERVITNASIVF